MNCEYQKIPQPKINYKIIFENCNDEETKLLQRSAKAFSDIVRLVKVPFPPEITEEDLIGLTKKPHIKSKAPNKFLIYRKWYTMCLRKGNQKNSQTAISPYISKQWKMEPQHVKDYYHELSVRANNLLKVRYGEDGIGKYELLINNFLKIFYNEWLNFKIQSFKKKEKEDRIIERTKGHVKSNQKSVKKIST